MKPQNAVVRLCWLIAMLALFSSGVGLFYQDGGHPFWFTTLHGTTVQMYGRGVYRNETLLNGAGFKGIDAFIVVFVIPLLVIATRFYRRGSLRGGLVLLGVLACFVYNAAHQALNYAYNHLFLVYVTLFSGSFFALALMFTSFDLQAMPARFSSHLPHRAIAAYLFTVGAALLIIWGGMSALPALLQGKAPEEVASYTTLPTYAIDMGLIAPVSFLAGLLLLRRRPLGYLLAATMVIISWTIGGEVMALSLAQILAGLLTGFQFAVFVAPFAILTLVGMWLTVVLFQHCSEPAALRASPRDVRSRCVTR